MELTRFIIGQVVGAARIGVASYSFRAKKQSKNVFWQMTSTALYAMQYLILGFMSGAAVMGISTVRSLTFYILNKRNIKPNGWTLAAFTAVSVAAGLATWKDAFSILPILSASIVTYGQWQKNLKTSKISLIAANVVLMVCNLSKGAYVDFAGTSVISAAGIAQIVRDSRVAKRQRVESGSNSKPPQIGDKEAAAVKQSQEKTKNHNERNSKKRDLQQIKERKQKDHRQQHIFKNEREKKREEKAKEKGNRKRQ